MSRVIAVLLMLTLAAPCWAVVDCPSERGFVPCPTTDCAQCVCYGDVNGDGQITVDELVTVITEAVEGCPLHGHGVCWGDQDLNTVITMDEIMHVLTEMQEGCP